MPLDRRRGPLQGLIGIPAASLGLNRQVSFLGYRQDVWRLLQGSDIFVFSSLGEGFGLAVLEAMSAENPMVAFSVTSMPEIIVDGSTGVLDRPRDVQALAQALCHLADRPEERERMGMAGRLRAIKEFAVERMVEATEQLCLDLQIEAFGGIWRHGLTPLSWAS